MSRLKLTACLVTATTLATLLLSAALTRGEAPAASSSADKVDFAKQIQPILKQNCYACHGPEKQKGKLRLDSRELSLQGGGSGPAINPGHGKDSYLVKRIKGEGEEDRMPVKRDPLTAEQISLITKWIDQGADWPASASVADAKIAKHWAYEPPVRPELPAVKQQGWVRNPIDAFVLAKMEQEGLSPSPEADRVTQIRRLCLDLTGIPPTPQEVDAFVNDKSENAYEQLVDRLLASPQYGERWGRHWLDLARYADTNGYEKDRTRSIWPYRDWVINAINADMPFDEFTVEQLAGDMMPNATPSQRIATGFHRNTMINEEGGIDVEEFRYKALVDRVQTTATTWLGTTLHCAQCHSHKYDPITQKEYYQFMALLNNGDEPSLDVPPSATVAAKRHEIEQQIAKVESEYERHFPAGEETGPVEWTVIRPTETKSKHNTVLRTLDDGSVLASGPKPPTDSYTIALPVAGEPITSLRLEVLTAPSLPKTGPGRAPNGNFVLTELKATVAAGDGKPTPVKFAGAAADFSQAGFAVTNAIDGDANSGWAIDDGAGHTNQNRAATFTFAEPLKVKDSATLTVTLDQDYTKHTLGHFRLSVGRARKVESQPTKTTREQFLAQKFGEWEKSVASKAAHWTVLEPTQYSRNYSGSITKLPDNSLLFTGDDYYRDEYHMQFRLDPAAGAPRRVTAIRMEVLPDARLENGGPGRNPAGGWLVSEFIASAAPATQPTSLSPVLLQNASADTGSNVANAIDGKRDSHWAQPVGDAQPHELVMQVKGGLDVDEAKTLAVNLVENYHQQENVGRLRISVTGDEGEIQASGLSAALEQIVLTPSDQRTPEQQAALKQHFLATTPLLAGEHQRVAELKKSMPALVTTMVMQERAVQRPTHIHRRGEFLQLGAEVQPNVPAVLPPLPAGQPHNRLTFARWLVDGNNPLTGRVVMNRTWANYFGHGIVKSLEDFGTIGEKPTHPELLDWLATEFVRQHWSMKAMHRLIVTSATYRQSSKVTPELLAKDPGNDYLARFPRQRVEAEVVRDIALSAAGLLTEKVGGPSVYPPQPAGVSEESWANSGWPESKGPERFRRGLYTFFKRTAPHPELMTFDGPTSEVVCARRIRSNTPLQALTILNDTVFIEAAQGLAGRVMTHATDDAGRAALAFRLCVSRMPDEHESGQVVAFYRQQLAHFREDGSDAKKVAVSEAVPAPKDVDVAQLAAWTTVSRSLLNLDETITRN